MKKIMFSDAYGLTEAVLSGRKTQTRRILKGKPLFPDDDIEDVVICGDEAHIIANGGESLITAKLPYKVGEVVAVAQSYKSLFEEDCRRVKEGKPMRNITIKNVSDHPGWTNKLFVKPDQMPNRIRITNVRVERLQDISCDDCEKEGFVKCDDEICKTKCYLIPGCRLFHCGNGCEDPREAYAALIDRISGRGTWLSNPWVFAYDFELVK